jgi:hypothetical protein
VCGDEAVEGAVGGVGEGGAVGGVRGWLETSCVEGELNGSGLRGVQQCSSFVLITYLIHPERSTFSALILPQPNTEKPPNPPRPLFSPP